MSKHREASTELSDVIAAWREMHWPSRAGTGGWKTLVPGLSIYEGTHAQLTALSHSLGELMLKLEPHILDACDGRVPRWMAIPKLMFHVERLNVVEAPAKASKRISDMVHLSAACGKFEDTDENRLVEWFDMHPGQELVAHKLFKDVRAFAHVAGKPGKRLRFMESGLAVAPPPGITLHLQDHRDVIRGARNDAFCNPLAINASGWRVFVPVKGNKPQQ